MLTFKYNEFAHMIQTEPMYMIACSAMLVVAACGVAILCYEVISWFWGVE